MRKIALVLSVVLSLGVSPVAAHHSEAHNRELEKTVENIITIAIVGAVMLAAMFYFTRSPSNDLAGFRSEDDPDTGRFFVSPHIDAGTDAGITFGYQLRF